MSAIANPQVSSPPLPAAYDQDFAAWAEATIQLLEQQRFSEIDVENLIEEVEGLVKSDKRELKNRLYELLLHLLKWQYQPQRRAYPGTDNAWDENSWARSISNQRYGMEDLLADSPSLRSCLSVSLDQCYQRARKGAAQETQLPVVTFPEACPYTESQILDDEFWPA